MLTHVFNYFRLHALTGLPLSGDLLATVARFPAAAARAVGYLGNSLYLAASDEPGLRVMARANPVKVLQIVDSLLC